MPLPQEPSYQAQLHGWHPTAWEPPTAALQQAFHAMEDQHWAEAAAKIDAAIARDPAASDAYQARSVLHALQNHWATALAASDAAVMLTNQYHHYVHYICSAIHTARAEWATEDTIRDEAIASALFQDHTNPRILALKAGAHLPLYALPMWEDAEWPKAIRVPAGILTAHDFNSGAWLCRDAAPVRRLAALAFGHAAENRMEEARSTMEETAKLAHRWHRHYHRQASLQRLQRGRVYEALNEPYLALDEYRHAHDIDPSYGQPLRLRAALNRNQGNDKLAASDELKAQTLP